ERRRQPRLEAPQDPPHRPLAALEFLRDLLLGESGEAVLEDAALLLVERREHVLDLAAEHRRLVGAGRRVGGAFGGGAVDFAREAAAFAAMEPDALAHLVERDGAEQAPQAV